MVYFKKKTDDDIRSESFKWNSDWFMGKNSDASVQQWIVTPLYWILLHSLSNYIIHSMLLRSDPGSLLIFTLELGILTSHQRPSIICLCVIHFTCESWSPNLMKPKPLESPLLGSFFTWNNISYNFYKLIYKFVCIITFHNIYFYLTSWKLFKRLVLGL